MVVADLDEEAANETLRSLSRDHKVQQHMAAVVDVSSKQSVESLVESIQVRDRQVDTQTGRHRQVDAQKYRPTDR